MKLVNQSYALMLLFASGSSSAAEPTKSQPDPAPIACYEQVWGSVKKGLPGLGLTAGQAVELCGGATDADKVIRCFSKAWAHVDDGGLGLAAGQAIRLCKANSQVGI